jgi:hypothetical protein
MSKPFIHRSSIHHIPIILSGNQTNNFCAVYDHHCCEAASPTRHSRQGPVALPVARRGARPCPCPTDIPPRRGNASLATKDLCIPVERGAGGSAEPLPSRESASIPCTARLPDGSSERPRAGALATAPRRDASRPPAHARRHPLESWGGAPPDLTRQIPIRGAVSCDRDGGDVNRDFNGRLPHKFKCD